MVMPPGAAMAWAGASTLFSVSKSVSFVGCCPPRAVNGNGPTPEKRTPRPGAPGTDLEHVCEVGTSVQRALSNPPELELHRTPSPEGERSYQTTPGATSRRPSSGSKVCRLRAARQPHDQRNEGVAVDKKGNFPRHGTRSPLATFRRKGLQATTQAQGRQYCLGVWDLSA